MNILAVTNLYPTPPDRQRGVFNSRLFAELALQHSVSVLVFVPEWRIWRWREIRKWKPVKGQSITYLPVFYLPLFGRNLSWWFYSLGLRRFNRDFSDCNVVLATWLYPDCVAASKMASLHGKPIWFKVHGSDRFHLNNKDRLRIIYKASEYAQGFLPNCDFLADELKARGFEPEKIHVVRHGVDNSLFYRRPKEEALQQLASYRELESIIKKDKKIILFAGHLKMVKGVDIALKAFAKISKQVSRDLKLVMIGDGPIREMLKELASGFGIADKVVFLGNRPQKDVALWMNVADCLLLASRSEGMPNVVIEALASGTPVVATDVGDVRSVLNESGGEVVKAHGKDISSAIAKAIERTLDKKWDSKTISDSVSQFTWSATADKVINLLEKSQK